MGTFLLVVAEANAAHSESAGGFGLNLDILQTNIINLAILIGVLFYLGRKALPKILNERRSNIETAIRDAEQRARQAAAALQQQQQKLDQARSEAERIAASAVESAKVAKENIMAQAIKDIERMKAEASRDLESERERVIAQLRQQVVSMALQKVESQLQSSVDQSVQQKLIERSIALLGGS